MTGLIKIFKSILNLIYKAMCSGETEDKVLFMSRESDKAPLDFILLEDYIKRNHPRFKTVMLCKKIGPGIPGKLSYGFHILRQTREMASSKLVILDTYNIPASVLKHRDKQVIAQIWHSIGTMKKNSYSILDQGEGRSSKIAYAMNMHQNYDLIFCAGEGYKAYLAESFNYPPEALTVIPLPRVDRLRDQEWNAKKREEILSKHPELRDKKIVLYGPTFRSGIQEKEEFRKAVEALREASKPYSEDYQLVVKAHPLSHIESDYPEYSTMETLTIADAFISDYSCTIYEAGIMDIPLYFYTYDYDNYMSQRSVYMDYPREIPGKMHAEAKALMDDIAKGGADIEREKEFISKYIDLPSGSCTEAMAETMLGKVYEL